MSKLCRRPCNSEVPRTACGTWHASLATTRLAFTWAMVGGVEGGVAALGNCGSIMCIDCNVNSSVH